MYVHVSRKHQLSSNKSFPHLDHWSFTPANVLRHLTFANISRKRSSATRCFVAMFSIFLVMVVVEEEPSGETCLETFNFQSVRTDCMFSIFLVMVVEEEEPTIRTTPFSPRPRLFWNQSDPLVAVEILCTNPDEF